MASPAKRPPTENQVSSNPGNQVLITSHNDEGKAVVKATEPVKVRLNGLIHLIRREAILTILLVGSLR